MRVDNLYSHPDGGYYCLLSEDAPMKHPVSEEWVDGVIYTGVDGRMRSTTMERWTKRFVRLVDYGGNDADVLAMIRRCNPDQEFGFIRVFESWHESELQITTAMLELAVAATLERHCFENPAPNIVLDWDKPEVQGDTPNRLRSASIMITTEDLQRVNQQYGIEKIAEPHGFLFKVTRLAD